MAVGVLLVVFFLFSFLLGLTRPLETVGRETSGRVQSISGTGSDRRISYSFSALTSRRTGSDTAWAFETRWLRKGGTVPVVYDPKWPSRNRLGTRDNEWGEWRPSSFFKQAGMRC